MSVYQTAYRLLYTYGQAALVTRNVKSAFDVATGEAGIASTSTFNIVCYTSNYTKSEIDNTLVQRRDIKLIVSSATAMNIDDVVTIDAKDYRVLDVQIVKFRNTDIIYKCQVRV